MALQLTIAGTDRTKLVIPESLRITNVLTKKVDTASFDIKKFGTRTFAPTVGQEVVITNSGTRIFAGRIVKIYEDYDKLDLITFKIDCVDYTRDLDKKLVIESYENQTVNAIIADLQTQGYIPANFTLTNVNCAVQIKYIAFNYEYVSKVLEQLAEITNYDWYVDYSRNLYFFAKESLAAPFELSDTSGNYVYESLRIRKDITPIRNTIYVRGGEYKADPFTVEVVADGSERVFDTKYRFSDISVMNTGQLKSVGVDGLDQETDYDVLYNFEEKIIKFREDKKPTINSVVKWWGQPWLPVIVKLRDNASIAAFSATEGNDGIYEFKIIDKSIKSKTGARQRAQAELVAYASTISEGSFITYEDGLKAGMRFHVDSDLRGIDSYYIINKVEITAVAVNESSVTLRYFVSLMSTRTFDQIDLLIKLLTQEDKKIEIAEDEVLDEIETADESLTISEAITTTADTPPYQYGAGGHPQGVWNLSEWG